MRVFLFVVIVTIFTTILKIVSLKRGVRPIGRVEGVSSN